jgi:predicted RNase H-like nuclease (RuvC/YqgF family)
MINFQKLIAIFLLPVLLVVQSPIAKAEENNDSEGFVDLKEGEAAPSDGLFFDNEAMAKLLAKQQSKLSLLENTKNTEIKKIELELEILSKKKEIELNINKEMHNSMLKIREDKIELLEKQNKWSSLYMVGGFLVGVTISITIFYAAVQIK